MAEAVDVWRTENVERTSSLPTYRNCFTTVKAERAFSRQLDLKQAVSPLGDQGLDLTFISPAGLEVKSRAMDSSQAWAPSSCATSSPSYLQRALPPVPPPKDEISLAPASRQPSHYRTASYSRPTSLSLSQTASFASNDTTSSRAMSPSTTSSRAGSMRLARRARSPSPSLGGEEDLSFPSQETAYSASLSSPRSVSPTNARHHKFMKKLNSKWMSTREQQDADLDFGCAGEAWSSGSATASTSEQVSIVSGNLDPLFPWTHRLTSRFP